MAKASKAKIKSVSNEESIIPAIQQKGPKPKLKKMEVSNFRAIGKNPVTIELDDIVVLVGANNAGKSSILKAYQVVMSHGSKDADLSLSDFPNEAIVEECLPCITLTTAVVDANSPGEKWIAVDPDNGEKLVRERWTWQKPGSPIREGFDVVEGKWVESVPWGAPNVANSMRPKPYRVDAFENPEKQSAEIVSIISDSLEERLLGLKNKNDTENEAEENDFKTLFLKISELQKKVLVESQEQITKIEHGISSILQAVFPNYVVKFDGRADSVDEKAVTFFKGGSRLLMGPSNGFQGAVNQHGSGARRTLLWSALKFITDAGLKKEKKPETASERPHILLIDEPELCLHPSAVRQACKVLYDLPKSGNWQVMVTTHSPIFIDLSRDNTTVVRVDRADGGEISSCTLYKPQRVNLTDDERTELKLLNLFDPYVAEFFFGGNIVIVEGDTEYSALKYVAEKENLGANLQIIRARGKSTIISLSKILNQFSAKYAILHDSDKPKINVDGKEQVNGAWTTNSNILEAVKDQVANGSVKLLASIPNFEEAYLGSPGKKGDKPYSALLKIKKEEDSYNEIKKLLISLTNFEEQPPQKCLAWNSIDQLAAALPT
jgi:putative ATP-dependent endonuclease of OLD family